MAENITPRSKDFSEWYQDVVTRARLADYSPVKGCMVIRPNGYSIWEIIQKNFNKRIEALGVENAYFPVFIPESFIKKEAEHVEGFAPQLAVVTHAGGKDLEEKLVVRPTSETIINSMFSKWIQSYRDLPLLMNQWANVVRWEMRTRLFLRTTEFLWQEGHTCHATLDDAEAFTRVMIQEYAKFSHEVLAMPVYWGLKSESEKFAGALRTYCIEAMLQDRKALQAGTSHNLSNHFAKAFNTQFLDSDKTLKHVYQTSWGVSTRLIGGMVMTHSDDKGLVLPPRLAKTHVVVIPIFGKNEAENQQVVQQSKLIKEELEKISLEDWDVNVRVKLDLDDSKHPGWKFHEYEMVGIPIRVEVGPRDLAKNQVCVARRDVGKKEFIPRDGLVAWVTKNIPSMQSDLLASATKLRDESTFAIKSYSEFKEIIEAERGFVQGAWCGSSSCEAKAKEETKATLRCMLLDSQYTPIVEDSSCVICGGQSLKGKNVRTIFAKAY